MALLGKLTNRRTGEGGEGDVGTKRNTSCFETRGNIKRNANRTWKGNRERT